ncbi:MAG: ABC transporter permease [Alphaproteobacteria bacterium]|nr:ABC transporter permease [Alphaproteobacteria bacterium]
MLAIVLRRLIEGVLVMAAMTFAVFLGVNVIGNPVDILIPADCAQECRRLAMQRLGLDRPIWEQYWIFLVNLAQGDLGRSFVYGAPSLRLILERMPATLELALTAMTIAIAVGLPLGMWAGLRPQAISSRLVMLGSIVGFSVPTFWVGLVLIMVFAVELRLLPTTGRGETVSILGVPVSLLTADGLAHIALPALNLAIYKISLVIRLARAGMREAIVSEYVKFARAKGLTTRRVVFVHVLKNIMIPIVTIIGLELGSVIAFAVVTETIFAWPGMGKLIIESIKVLDRPVIVAYLMITVAIFVILNLAVDLTYAALDPRVRLGGRRS